MSLPPPPTDPPPEPPPDGPPSGPPDPPAAPDSRPGGEDSLDRLERIRGLTASVVHHRVGSPPPSRPRAPAPPSGPVADPTPPATSDGGLSDAAGAGAAASSDAPLGDAPGRGAAATTDASDLATASPATPATSSAGTASSDAPLSDATTTAAGRPETSGSLSPRHHRPAWMAAGLGVATSILLIAVVAVAVTLGTHSNARSSANATGPVPTTAPASTTAPPTTAPPTTVPRQTASPADAGGATGTRALGAVYAGAASIPTRTLALTSRTGLTPRVTGIKGPEWRFASRPVVLFAYRAGCRGCVGQGWALVVALSHFGVFSGGPVTNQPGSFFSGVDYSSRYLAFAPAFLADPAGHQPSATETAALRKHDPGLDAPFVDLAGRTTLRGSQLPPGTLVGVPSESALGTITAGRTAASRKVRGAAAVLMSQICAITGGKPGAVCHLFPHPLPG